MLTDFLLKVGIIYILIVITFFHALYGLKRNISAHRYLLIILFAFVINEIVSAFFIINELTEARIHITISTLIHNIFWLLIIKKAVRFPRIVNGLLIALLTFSFCDLVFIEGWRHFNCYSFILGAFMYLVIFLVESFYQLKQENFTFFFSNQFLLLTSPVLFFFGLTLLISFKSHDVITTVLFGKVDLYQLIITMVNIVYYTLLNLYIYKERNTDTI